MSCFNVKQAVSMVCTIIILDIFANTQFFICLLKSLVDSNNKEIVTSLPK